MSQNNNELKIVTSPDPILFRKAKQVKIFDEKLKKLTEKMNPVMHKADGMGLAAPQIGQSIQLAILEYIPREEDKEKHEPIPFTVLINPKIIRKSKEMNTVEEGCLSLPDVNLDIPRHNEITVIFQDLEGSRKRINAKGLLSRMIQHEVDHLNGILITDRHTDATQAEDATGDEQE